MPNKKTKKIITTPVKLSSNRCLNQSITQCMDQLEKNNRASQENAALIPLVSAISIMANGVNKSIGISVRGEMKERISKNRIIQDLEIGRCSKLSSSNTGRP